VVFGCLREWGGNLHPMFFLLWFTWSCNTWSCNTWACTQEEGGGRKEEGGRRKEEGGWRKKHQEGVDHHYSKFSSTDFMLSYTLNSG